ncbi:hypothetical protein ACSQ76_18005 [Roseovarius sp. B08]|uniref:hypothetical protein n=1 Tax=Roseovarius sp. B08 TaxID=3449223 RepID=UPI003EDBE093
MLDPRDEAPMEGEMILATIRGIYRETITNEELKLRSMTDFDWTRLGQDEWTDQRVDGRMSRVFERRIAFFPKRAGTLELLPIVHELEVPGDSGQRETVLVRSEPVRIEVVEKPAGAEETWFPVRALEVSDTWDADAAQLEDGQGVTRRVVLRALGATPEMMPQQPALREPWLITFTPPEERDFQVTSQGPVTTLVWVWKLRPITGEPGVLPEVTIPYFDTEARTARVAKLPAAPIGYANFGDNAAAGWRKDIGVGQAHIAVFSGATMIVVLLALRGRSGASSATLALRRKLHLKKQLRRLRKYAATEDIPRFRALAAHLLSSETVTPLTRDHIALRPVDIFLFGSKSAHPALDLRSVLRDIEERLRTSSRHVGM